MDVAGLISSMATGTYALRRYALATFDGNGRQVPGAATSRGNIDAAVWPSRGREIDRLPEGQRTNEAYTVVAAVELQTPTEVAGGTGGDVITIAGKDYQVEHVRPWRDGGYEAVCTRMS